MVDPSIWKLIQRYISGRCSTDERQRLKQWMQKDPENEQLVTDLEQIWKETPREEFQVNVEEAWDTFRHRTMDRNNQVEYQPSHSKASSFAVKFMRVAAVILIVALSGLLIWQYREKPPPNTVNHGNFYIMQDLVTEQGERARVKFSDGTSVILNAASALRFPKKFSGPKRVVYLEGEAFFDVAHNSERPFVVSAQGADVEVLGTEFNVRAWNEEPDMGVTVREGKVALSVSSSSSASDRVVLTRGQYSTFRKGQGPTPARNVDVNNYLLWLNGGMHFDNTPFSRVVRQMERRFDIQITVRDKELLDVPLTAVLKNADLNEVLNVISASMEIDYRKKGSTVEFRTPLHENKNSNQKR